MISVFVSAQKLNIKQPVIAADTIDYLTVNFSFLTADWRGADKWAHFRAMDYGKVYDINLIEDKITADQHLNLKAGEYEVYLHGNKDGCRITTVPEKIIVQETGFLHGDPLPEVPLSAAEQIAQKADNAERIAQDVEKRANAGEFKGEKGEKGETGLAGADGKPGIQQSETPPTDGSPVWLKPTGGKVSAFSQYRHIETFTLEADAKLKRNKEPDGTPYNFQSVVLRIRVPESPAFTGSVLFGILDSNRIPISQCTLHFKENEYCTVYHIFNDHGLWTSYFTDLDASFMQPFPLFDVFNRNYEADSDKYKYIANVLTAQPLPAGTTIEIWGY